jgi:hypothetical protein
VRKQQRTAAVTSLDHRCDDEEIAEAIVYDELGVNRSVGKAWAIDDVKCRIEKLRTTLREANARSQRPSDANKTIEKVADHARALAAAVEQLRPEWRRMFSLVFYERGPDGGVLLCADRDRGAEAETRMREWISDLNRVDREFGRMRASQILPDHSGKRRRNDFFLKPKSLCAYEASKIIIAVEPSTKLTKGDDSKFYKITSLIWEAATGQPTRI